MRWARALDGSEHMPGLVRELGCGPGQWAGQLLLGAWGLLGGASTGTASFDPWSSAHPLPHIASTQVGLNNMKANDYANVVVQALIRVWPIR